MAAPVCLALAAAGCSVRPLVADPESMAAAPPELVERLRADPFSYFRFVNHEWTTRVCEIFAADLPQQPIVQLHGDAHLEQYAIMNADYGLDDFDDAARGPALVDVVRFLGSIELAVDRRGWHRDRDQLFDRFFAGYRRGLADPAYLPPEPPIVKRIREAAFVPTAETFLATAESKMTAMDDMPAKGVAAAMRVFGDLVRQQRPDIDAGYFRIVRAGWLQVGIGSAIGRKVLIRVRGPSDDPTDDVVLEAKASRRMNDVPCLEAPDARPGFRVVSGTEQVGRLRHSILVAGPEVALPEMTVQGEHLRNWWIRSWDRSYREISLDDPQSVEELSTLVFDSGVQLAAGSLHRPSDGLDDSLRQQLTTTTQRLEPRLRSAANQLIEELVAAWRGLAR
jgi:hypothetical protein